VGTGLGDVEYIQPKRPTYCVCWCSILTLLLLGLIAWLLLGDATATTTAPMPLPTCGIFQCPGNFVPKPNNAATIGNDMGACCDKTCSLFACSAGFTSKFSAPTIVGADTNTCCDQQACGTFHCPFGFVAKPATGNSPGHDQNTCCDQTCGNFQCPEDYRLKPNAASIRGIGRDVCCVGRKATCIVYGDPHCNTFDGKHNDYYTTGEFWIVKSPRMSIQGRYLPTHITRGLSVTKEITVGGPFMKGHILRISSTSVTWDGTPILTTFPSTFQADGVLDVTYNDHGKILQRGRELGKNLKILHINLPEGMHLQVNQWSNPEEGFFINTEVEMTPQPGQDGHCGNFNGNAADDDRLAIRARLGNNGIEQADLIGFKTKTPVVQEFEGYPTISECPSTLLVSAHAKCQAEEGHFIPTMTCLAKKCSDYKGQAVIA